MFLKSRITILPYLVNIASLSFGEDVGNGPEEFLGCSLNTWKTPSIFQIEINSLSTIAGKFSYRGYQAKSPHPFAKIWDKKGGT